MNIRNVRCHPWWMLLSGNVHLTLNRKIKTVFKESQANKKNKIKWFLPCTCTANKILIKLNSLLFQPSVTLSFLSSSLPHIFILFSLPLSLISFSLTLYFYPRIESLYYRSPRRPLRSSTAKSSSYVCITTYLNYSRGP